LNFNKSNKPGIAHDVASGIIAAERVPEGHRRRQKAHLIVAYFCDSSPYFLQLLKVS
jgi:hypothetical protein